MDKDCPLCVWEMDMINKKQKKTGIFKLEFINSASKDYDAE